MPPKNARKRAPKASTPTAPTAITLGEEVAADSIPIEPSRPPSPTPTDTSSYPLEPLLVPHDQPLPHSNDTQSDLADTQDKPAEISDTEIEVAEVAEKLSWAEDMLEMLVDTLDEVFQAGGAADNSFKKSAFEKAAIQVRKAYKGSVKVTFAHCKNKWADLKKKWSHWVFLGKQSGIGFSTDTELYEAADYVWDALNKAHPTIIWHKTHVMPFRETIGFILHDIQANGTGAISLEDPISIDPRISSLRANSEFTTSPRSLSTPLEISKTLYKKPKKRLLGEDTSGTEESSQPPPKRIDLGAAISSLSKEIERTRKAKEAHESNQQKAVKLLEKEYKQRLDVVAFLHACTLFKDNGNAVTFITLTDTEVRDRWLEMETNSLLLQ
jgi:hypothetical protein